MLKIITVEEKKKTIICYYSILFAHAYRTTCENIARAYLIAISIVTETKLRNRCSKSLSQSENIRGLNPLFLRALLPNFYIREFFLKKTNIINIRFN